MGRARFCTGGRLVCFRHLPCGCVSQRHSCRPCPRTSWQHKRACRSCRMHPVERRFLINALMYGNKRDRLLMLYLRLCRFRCNSPWQHCYSCSKPIDEMASGIDSYGIVDHKCWRASCFLKNYRCAGACRRANSRCRSVELTPEISLQRSHHTTDKYLLYLMFSGTFISAITRYISCDWWNCRVNNGTAA